MQKDPSKEFGSGSDSSSSLTHLRQMLNDLKPFISDDDGEQILQRAFRQLQVLEDTNLPGTNFDPQKMDNTDQQFQQHDSMLEVIFDITPIGVAVATGPDGIVTFANQAYLMMLPHPDMEVVGTPIGKLWPLEEGFQAARWYQQVYEHSKMIHNEKVLRVYPDGSSHYFSLHVQPFCWNAEQGALIVASEITTLVESHKEAEESKRILDALMRYIPEGITIADAPDVHIRQVSKFGQEMTGRGPEDIEGIAMGDHPEKWQIYYPDRKLVPAEQLPLSRATLTGEVIENEELVMRRPDGDEITILCNAGPIFDEIGAISGGLIAWRDITERQKNENALKQHEELLQILVDTIPIMIVLYRPDIKVATVNKEFERVTGWTNDEVQQIDIMEACYPDPVYRQKVVDFMASLEGWMDIDFTIKDGTLIETRWSNFRLADETNVGIGLDVRQQKRAQSALEESEARFRSVLDHSIDAAYRRDLRSDRYDYMSPSIQKILGFSVEEMVAMSTQEVVERMHPDEHDMVQDAIVKIQEEGQGKLEYRFKGKDGEYRWLSDYSNIIYSSEGLPLYRAGIVRDITEKKQYEQDLEASERRIRALADNIAQFAWMADPSGWIYWYNQRWFDYTGTTLDEMQGWGWQKVHHPEHRERVVEKFKLHLEHGIPWEDTFPLRGKDGEYRWFLSRALPIFDWAGQVQQWFGTNTDITEQLQVEEALRLSEGRFRIALEGSPMVVFTMDTELRYTWVYNPREGFPIEQIIGKRDEDLVGEEAGSKLTAFKRKVLTHNELQQAEITYKIGQKEVTYNITAEPLRDEWGAIIGLIAAAIDLTDIRRMEHQVIEHRTRIEVQRRLIAQREEERARIAREIHDGPVQSLSVLLFGLEELNWIQEPDERSTKISEIAESVQSEIKQLRGLCNELRPTTLHFFGLEKAIRSHVDALAERFPEIEFQVDLVSDRLSIPVDIRLEMYRILQEALNNCIKHANASEVRVFLSRKDSTITLEIDDNGNGFIINPRWEEYAKRGSLGLIGMQERAEIIGANFLIDSHPGGGTRLLLQVQLPSE
jgi:PAS domain S-box-containing protein